MICHRSESFLKFLLRLGRRSAHGEGSIDRISVEASVGRLDLHQVLDDTKHTANLRCIVVYLHIIRATEPEGSFVFRTLEHGPEVWRAEVTRR